MLDEHFAIWLVRSAILRAYEEGNAVVAGRGGRAILRDKPGVPHVRLVASLESRIARRSDPLFYHLVLNTDLWGIEGAAQCIVGAQRQLTKWSAATEREAHKKGFQGE